MLLQPGFRGLRAFTRCYTSPAICIQGLHTMLNISSRRQSRLAPPKLNRPPHGFPLLLLLLLLLFISFITAVGPFGPDIVININGIAENTPPIAGPICFTPIARGMKCSRIDEIIGKHATHNQKRAIPSFNDLPANMTNVDRSAGGRIHCAEIKNSYIEAMMRVMLAMRMVVSL